MNSIIPIRVCDFLFDLFSDKINKQIENDFLDIFHIKVENFKVGKIEALNEYNLRFRNTSQVFQAGVRGDT